MAQELDTKKRLDLNSNELVFLLSNLSINAKTIIDMGRSGQPVPMADLILDIIFETGAKLIHTGYANSKSDDDAVELTKSYVDAFSQGLFSAAEAYNMFITAHNQRYIPQNRLFAVKIMTDVLRAKDIFQLSDIESIIAHQARTGYRTLSEIDNIIIRSSRHLLLDEDDTEVMNEPPHHKIKPVSEKIRQLASEYIEENSGKELSPKPLCLEDFILWEADYMTYGAKMMEHIWGCNYQDIPVSDLADVPLYRRYFHVEPDGDPIPISALAEYKAHSRLDQIHSFFRKSRIEKTKKLAELMADRIREIIRAEAMELEACAYNRAHFPEKDQMKNPPRSDNIALLDTPGDVFLDSMGEELGKRFVDIKNTVRKEIDSRDTLFNYRLMSEEELYALFAMKRGKYFDFCAPVHDFHFKLAYAGHRMRALLEDPEKNLEELTRNIEYALTLTHTTDAYFANDMFGDEEHFRHSVDILNILSTFSEGKISDYSALLEESSFSWMQLVAKSTMLRDCRNVLQQELEPRSRQNMVRSRINIPYLIFHDLLDEEGISYIIKNEKPLVLQELYLSRKCRFSERNIDEAIRRGHYIFDLMLARGSDFTERNISTLIEEFLKPMVRKGDQIPKIFAYYPKEDEVYVRGIAYLEAVSRISEFLGDRINEDHLRSLEEMNTLIGDDQFAIRIKDTLYYVEFGGRNEESALAVVAKRKASELKEQISDSDNPIYALVNFFNPARLSGGSVDAITANFFKCLGWIPDMFFGVMEARKRGIDVLDVYKKNPRDATQKPSLDRHLTLVQATTLDTFFRACPGVYLESQCSDKDVIYVLQLGPEAATDQQGGMNFLLQGVKLEDTALYRVSEKGIITDFPLMYEVAASKKGLKQQLEELVRIWRKEFDTMIEEYTPLELAAVARFPNTMGFSPPKTSSKVRYQPQNEAYQYRISSKLHHSIADMFERTLGAYPEIFELMKKVQEKTTAVYNLP